MDRKAVGRQFFDLLESPCYVLFRLFGQSEDNVHVDIVEAGLSAQSKGVTHLLHRMPAADEPEGLLLHGLGIDADAGDFVGPDDAEFVRCNAVRSSCLDRKFLNVLHGEIFFQKGKQPLQLGGFQCCRCAAADIDGIQHPAPHHFRGGCDLFFQSIQVVVHSVLPMGQIK